MTNERVELVDYAGRKMRLEPVNVRWSELMELITRDNSAVSVVLEPGDMTRYDIVLIHARRDTLIIVYGGRVTEVYPVHVLNGFAPEHLFSSISDNAWDCKVIHAFVNEVIRLRASFEGGEEGGAETNERLNVSVCDGKYTVVQRESGAIEINRNGKRWVNDPPLAEMILSLAQEVAVLRSAVPRGAGAAQLARLIALHGQEQLLEWWWVITGERLSRA